MLPPFLANEHFIRTTRLIAQSNPNEMKQLVRQDARQLARPALQLLVQYDAAFADKGRGVNRLAVFLV